MAVQIFFGFHYIAAKIVLEHLPPLGWAAIRALSAAAILLPVTMMRRRIWPRSLRDHGRIALYALFGVALNQSFFVLGLARTEASHSALINTMIPVATLLLAILMGRERSSASKIAGIGLSMAGALFLLSYSGLSLSGGILAGDLMTLVNALSYSFFLVISKPILERYSSDAVTALLLAYGSLMIAAAGIWQLDAAVLAAVPARAWAWGAFVILVPTVGAYLLNSWALKRVDSSVVALFIYLQPLLATGLAATMLGERITVGLVVSAVLIFAGLYVAVSARLPRRAAVGAGGA